MSNINRDDNSSLNNMNTDTLLIKVYRAIQETDRRLTDSIHEVDLKVVALSTRFDDLDVVSDSAINYIVATHKEECRRESKKSSPRISKPPSTSSQIRNPYTIGAGLMALAGAITAAIQALS